MVFQYATLICVTLEPIFGAPNPTSWPRKAQGPFWGLKTGPKQFNFVEGLVPHEVSQDFLRGEWFVWYPGTLWVYQFPPKPSQGKVLQGFSPNPKIQGPPLGPWVGGLLSLCGPLAYTTPDQPTRVGLYLYFLGLPQQAPTSPLTIFLLVQLHLVFQLTLTRETNDSSG